MKTVMDKKIVVILETRIQKSEPQYSTSKETSFASASRKDKERSVRINLGISHFNKARPNEASFPILSNSNIV